MLAFLQRGFARSLGLSKDVKYGKEVGARAALYLRNLSEPTTSLRFKIALDNLRIEYDLLAEDAALLPEPLALHLRLIELAETEETALELIRVMLNEPPIAMLFNAILSSAQEDSASRVRIGFTNDDAPINVLFEHKGTWKEAMTVPASLERPLKGFAVRVSRVGYCRLFPHISVTKPMPKDVTFTWNPDGQLLIDLLL